MKKLLLSLAAVVISNSAFSQYWTTQFTGFEAQSRGISGMHIKNANTVWAYAYDGVAGADIQEFTKTTDGGNTWTAGLVDLGDPSLNIQNIVGIDDNTAWVMASREGDGTGGVFKTSDGGDTWEFQIGGTAADSWNNWVHFYDANNGVFGSDPVGGYFEVYTTTDGGDNWTRVPSTGFPALLASEYGYTGGVTSVDGAVFFYTNKGRILRSTDKGHTWTVALPSGFVTDFGSAANNGLMTFSSANKGLVFKRTFAGQTPTALSLYRTTDGSTWSQVSYTGITASDLITSVAYLPGTDTLIATSANSTTAGSWKSLDNGSTWSRIDSQVQHGIVKCFDYLTCYSGGFSNSADNTGMFKSTGALAVNDVKSNTKSISIYPNPTAGVFSINAEGFAKTSKVTVTDMTGKIVKTFDSKDSYDISDLSKGTYLVTIKDANSIETKKVIKK